MNKILFFLPKISFGGAERILITLANEFTKNGYEVIIVVNEKIRNDIFSISDKINIHEIVSNNPFIVVYNLVRIVNFEKPKIALSALDNGNLYLLITSIFSRSEICYHPTIHCNLSQVIISEKSFKGKIARFILSFLYPRSKSIIAVSEGVSSDFLKYVSNNIVMKVIYNPVVTQELIFKSNENIEDDFTNSRKFKILSIGRFVEQKNFHLLLESFAIVNSLTPSILILIGDGPLLESYKKTIIELNLDKNVIFTGFTDNPYKYIKASDLFVLSSNYEGLPTVLIEAMACGTKVVSTDCPSGPREILEDGMWGTLVPVGDKYALANAMYESLFNLNPPNVLNRANDFTTEIAAKKYLEHFGFIQ